MNHNMPPANMPPDLPEELVNTWTDVLAEDVPIFPGNQVIIRTSTGFIHAEMDNPATDLGGGNFGKVRLARVYGKDGKYEGEHALKLPLPRAGSPGEDFPAVLARMQRVERTAVERGRHPGMARALAAGPGYLLMEFIKGPTLDQVMQNNGGALPVPRAVNIASQLADTASIWELDEQIEGDVGRDTAHIGQLVHMDFRPGNVILTGDDIPIVIDFGVAKGTGEHSPLATPHGFPPYATPEQVRGEIDPRITEAQLCFILLDMITGGAYTDARYSVTQRQGDEAAIEISQSNARGEYMDDVRRLLAQYNVDRELAGIILKGVQPDPLQRYQSAADLHAALQQYSASHSA